jgi:hypothetical protein
MVKVIPSIPDTVKLFITTIDSNYIVKFNDYGYGSSTNIYFGNRFFPKLVSAVDKYGKSSAMRVFVYDKKHEQFGIELSEFLQALLNPPDVELHLKYTKINYGPCI